MRQYAFWQIRRCAWIKLLVPPRPSSWSRFQQQSFYRNALVETSCWSDAAQVPCELESLSILVLASHSLAMYDVIMTNIEYSYKPGRFYIQYSTWHLVIVAFTCVFIVVLKFLLPCYFLQEQPAQTWIQRLTMGCREALCKMVLEKEQVIMENGSDLRDFYCLFRATVWKLNVCGLAVNWFKLFGEIFSKLVDVLAI